MQAWFAGSPDDIRSRRPSDALKVIIGLLLFLWMGFNTERFIPFEETIADFLRSTPEWFEHVYAALYLVGVLWCVVIVIIVAAQGTRRLAVGRDVVVAVVIAGVAVILMHRIIHDSWPELLPEITTIDGNYPLVRIVLVAAVVTVTAPSFIKPIADLGWWILGLTMVAAVGLGFALPFDTVGTLGLGIAAAGATLLMVGSPGGYPSRDELVEDLTELGVPVATLEPAAVQPWDARVMDGVTTDGLPVRLRALGRDAADSQVINRAWRSIWYRDEPRAHGYGRLERVEHEALATLIAARAGLRVPDVMAVGTAGADTALIATERFPISLAASDTDGMTAAWTEVGKLHAAAIAHGNLTVEAFSRDGEAVVIGDFGAASLNASERELNIDAVSLLFSHAVATDPANAVAAAVAGFGAERVIAALPFVQVPALSHAQKQKTKNPKIVVRQIANEIVEQTGTDTVTPERLRRVRPGDLVKPALSLLAAYALIGMLGDIDFVAVWDVVRNAVWAMIIVGFVIGQFVFIPEATGMRYATGYDIVLRPLVILQVSVKWIGLAIPSAAGRVAMNTAFLRKYGVPTTIAVSQGAIDGVSGFFVEAVILLIFFLTTDSVNVDIDVDDVPWGLILVIVVFLVFAVVVAVLRVQRLREYVLPVVKDAWGLLKGVIVNPARLIGLLTSNLVARLILAIVLWFVLQAIGTPLPILTCLVVTVATNLLAGLVPVPGGIGVAEAVLTTFLVFFGLDSDSAFAAAVVFRIATFYIPAGEGFFAMNWLDREGYI